jgi:hypothetical protein
VRPEILHSHFSKPGIIGMAAGVLARTPIRPGLEVAGSLDCGEALLSPRAPRCLCSAIRAGRRTEAGRVRSRKGPCHIECQRSRRHEHVFAAPSRRRGSRPMEKVFADSR